MNYVSTESNDGRTGRNGEAIAAEVPQQEWQSPLWLSEAEAVTLLTMLSLSPASGGATEEILFRKIGKLINSFETPHPKEI